jgi:hypothetical protein
VSSALAKARMAYCSSPGVLCQWCQWCE